MKKLGKKKLIIILVVVIVLLTVAGTAVFFLFLKKDEKAPEFYFSKEDHVASITSITEKDYVPEQKPPANKKKSKKSKSNKVTYTYTKVKTPAKDIKKYVAYLEGEKIFQDIEMPKELKEGETSDTASEAAPDAAEGKKKEKKKKHYELGLDSVKPGTLLKITIDVKKESYVITTKTSSELLEDVLAKKKKKEEEQASKSKKPYTRIDAEGTIHGYTGAELLLPNEPSAYNIISVDGRIQMNQKDYFDIRVYAKGSDGSNYIVARYFVDCNRGTEVLKYNIGDNSYTPIIKTSAPTPPQ
ncbi:MAG: hypothetical protein RR705_10625 [Lachnospiraceae bacterium]